MHEDGRRPTSEQWAASLVRGLYTTIIIVSGVGLSWAILAGLVVAVLSLPLDLAGVSTRWVTWFLQNVVLWVFGASLVGLLVAWVLPKLLNVLEQIIVWLNRQIRDASE